MPPEQNQPRLHGVVDVVVADADRDGRGARPRLHPQHRWAQHRHGAQTRQEQRHYRDGAVVQREDLPLRRRRALRRDGGGGAAGRRLRGEAIRRGQGLHVAGIQNDGGGDAEVRRVRLRSRDPRADDGAGAAQAPT